jgi:hypothetical protein
MSESNAPFNHPGQSESSNSASDWENPFAELAEEFNLQGDASIEDLQFESQFEEADFSQGAEHSSETLPKDNVSEGAATLRLTADPMAAIAAWSESAANTAESTDITDLISLIQELNQCNSILLDRVSQLEEALESSQIALQAEVGRSQDYQSFTSRSSDSVAGSSYNDLAAAQEQIISLFNQLEFAHQANQRQQILVETLGGQLESSQERVAELEREAALIQQRYNEQVQLLAQSETSNRDLQARLHRQQRYTMQFKAALEKCLEVPAPQYDLSGEIIPTTITGDDLFLPRAQRIQPWSAHTQGTPTQFPWMKLHAGVLDETVETSEDSSALDQPIPAIATTPASVAPIVIDNSAAKVASLKLPTFDDLSTPEARSDEPIEAEETIAPEQLTTPLSYNLKDLIENSEPTLVQPLVDLLTEALQDTTIHSEIASEVDSTIASERLAPLEAQAPLDHAPAQDPSLNVENLDEAEDALWQDLARLIEVSTEDVVRASLSGDFTAFEAIDFDAVQETGQSDSGSFFVTEEQKLEAPIPPAATDTASEAAGSASPQPTASEGTEATHQSFIPALSHSSWPSPIVHPLRPAKKQRSSGTVDLPSFLRPGTNPLAT